MIRASACPSVDSENNDRILSREEDLFTFLGIGNVFRRTCEILGARFAVFMTLTGIMLAPCALIGITFAALFGETVYEIETGNSEAVDYLNNHIPVFLAIFLVQLLVSVVIFIAGEAAMVRAAAEIYANDRTHTWKDNIKAGLGCFCTVFLANLIVFGVIMVLYLAFILFILILTLIVEKAPILGVLLMIIGYIALIVVYFVIVTATTLVFPVIVVEGKGPLDSLKRCWELSKQHLCYVFCSLFLLGTMKLVITLVLALLFNPPSILSPFGFFIIFLLPTLLFLPLQAIMRFVVYTSIRSLMEGYNEPSLQADMGNQGYSATTIVDDGEVICMGDLSKYSSQREHVTALQIA